MTLTVARYTPGARSGPFSLILICCKAVEASDPTLLPPDCTDSHEGAPPPLVAVEVIQDSIAALRTSALTWAVAAEGTLGSHCHEACNADVLLPVAPRSVTSAKNGSGIEEGVGVPLAVPLGVEVGDAPTLRVGLAVRDGDGGAGVRVGVAEGEGRRSTHCTGSTATLRRFGPAAPVMVTTKWNATLLP